MVKVCLSFYSTSHEKGHNKWWPDIVCSISGSLVFLRDSLFPTRERDAVEIIAASTAERTLRSNPRWQEECEEEKSPAAQCPWPKGKTSHVQTIKSRTLSRFSPQEMQNYAIWSPGQLWFQTNTGQGEQQQKSWYLATLNHNWSSDQILGFCWDLQGEILSHYV